MNKVTLEKLEKEIKALRQEVAAGAAALATATGKKATGLAGKLAGLRETLRAKEQAAAEAARIEAERAARAAEAERAAATAAERKRLLDWAENTQAEWEATQLTAERAIDDLRAAFGKMQKLAVIPDGYARRLADMGHAGPKLRNSERVQRYWRATKRLRL